MSLGGFLWRYFRRYAGWAAVAAVAILVYAAATAVLISLIEPIFSEVLLASADGGGLPASLSGLLGERADEPATGATGNTAENTAEPAAAAAPKAGVSEALKLRVSRADLKTNLDRAYLRLKRTLGIDDQNVIYFVPALFVVIFLLRSLADFVSGYAFQRIGLGATNDMRNDLYRRILEQSSRFHADHGSGELVSRVVSDVAIMQSAISSRLLDLFQQSVTLLLLLYLLLSTHFKLALICLVVAPILVVPIVRFGKSMRRTSHRSQERMADLANLVSEGVRGHRVVKAFGMEEYEHGRFRQATRRHLRVNLRAQVLSHLSSPVVESLAVLGAAALLIYAGRSIRAGELTAPLLVTVLANLLAMYDPIRKLNKVNLILQQSLAAAQRIRDLMLLPNDVAERPAAKEISGFEREVRFAGVSFAYDRAATPVLHGVDLELRRGEIVALVGPSGAGKSTVVNLLPRFFDPDAGRVAIDGVDVRELSLRSLRSLIGIVTQETVLFNDTVRNNIAYGRSDAPIEKVREAAAAAYADEFVMAMPEGYDSVIGEGGLRLSGGQRQRLAIARALFRDAPLLILDEATSQLDSESEALVQKALSNLMQGRTTLVIAHRLSTVKRADRIVVLERGQVIESGRHEELIGRGGLYKRLYDLQFQS